MLRDQCEGLPADKLNSVRCGHNEVLSIGVEFDSMYLALCRRALSHTLAHIYVVEADSVVGMGGGKEALGWVKAKICHLSGELWP